MLYKGLSVDRPDFDARCFHFQSVHVFSIIKGIDIAKGMPSTIDANLYLIKGMLVELRAMLVFEVRFRVDKTSQVSLYALFELSAAVRQRACNYI